MNVNEILKKNNIKLTKAREAVYNILKGSDTALNAEGIFNKCKENNIKIDLSTIYRCLYLFFENNIIDRLHTETGTFSYILKSKNHKHVLKCEFCDKKVEIECPIMHIEAVIKNKTGFTLLEKEFNPKCICEECRKKQNK